jgi:hypothetical protein
LARTGRGLSLSPLTLSLLSLSCLCYPEAAQQNALAQIQQQKQTEHQQLANLRGKCREFLSVLNGGQPLPDGPALDEFFCRWVDETIAQLKESAAK